MTIEPYHLFDAHPRFLCLLLFDFVALLSVPERENG